MRPFTLGVTTLVHGFYALIWVAIVLDVGSPSFNLAMPEWTASEAVVWMAVLFSGTAALGVVVHTVSRSVFHGHKEAWALEVLVSPTVQQRFGAFGTVETFPGGPTYTEAIKAEGGDRVRKAGSFLHALDFQLLARAPGVWHGIQSYRDQYRLARGFILTSAAFAPIVPLWEPVRALDEVGAIGPLPIVRTQLFLLAILASAVCYVAFRERTFRYSAAKLLAFATIEGERMKGEAP